MIRIFMAVLKLFEFCMIVLQLLCATLAKFYQEKKDKNGIIKSNFFITH